MEDADSRGAAGRGVTERAREPAPAERRGQAAVSVPVLLSWLIGQLPATGAGMRGRCSPLSGIAR